MRRRHIAGFLLLVAVIPGSAVALEGGTDSAAGRSIYRTGSLPDGAPVRATTIGGVEIEGTQASCATCHRRSGYGSTEGGLYVPPVTGPSLFEPRRFDRAERFRRLYQEVQPRRLYSEARDPRVRPAYSAESLAFALRHGRDPSGRVLDPVMPRYDLGEPEMDGLISYLQSLGAEDSPGVDSETIHFATVFTPDASPAGRSAVRSVIDAFVERKNRDTVDLLARPGSSPLHHDEFRASYRLWKVSEWRLTGASETWRRQLDEHYRRQPVFAVLGGLGAAEWRPVHEFCESVEVPCLFPNVDLPVREAGAYSLYLSPGLAGEASALSTFLRRQPAFAGPGRILQVFRPEERGRAMARGLAADFGCEGIEVVNLELDSDRSIGAAVRARVTEVRPRALVLWLGPTDVETLLRDTAWLLGVETIVVSHGLLGRLPAVGAAVRERLLVTYPLVLPGREPPRIYRVRAWLRSRGLPADEEPLRLNTHFALAVTEHALHHLVERFSRDYFIESVEHETENALNPGVYPRLSLGPGQRFASKGSYVVRLAGGSEPSIEPVGKWIVPEDGCR